MARSVWPRALAGLALFSLAGCGWIERAERPAWRTQAENLCLARGEVKPSAFIEPRPEIDGPGICGLTHPFKVSAVADGAVALDKPIVTDCSLIPALEAWLAQSVQPIAQARFGQPVVGLEVFGAYSCRSVDNQPGEKLSEHAFGNAVDVAGFRLADGREISIVRDWKRADTQEAAFLHEIHAGACQQFTTVLGPGADVFHYNHFHLDLAMHGATNTGPRRYCRPAPAPDLLPAPPRPDALPPAPEIDEPMDVSRAGPAPARARMAMAPLNILGPSAAVPPPVEMFESDPRPPILPGSRSLGVDDSPTSSVLASHDD